MKNKIARQFIVYIVLFSSIITLLITAVQLYGEFNYDLKGVQQRLQQIKLSYKESITEAVWISDRKQLQLILEGIRELPDIIYAEVNYGEANKIYAGSYPEGEIVEFKVDLIYEYNNKNIIIGHALVTASLDSIYSRLWNRLWIILLSNGFKTALVAVFIYFLFYQLIARHLSAISAFSEDHDPLSNNKLLTLDRVGNRHDEFDAVVTSINDMHARISGQVVEINQQKQYLSHTLNSIGDAVITTDNMGCVTRMNPVAEQLTGWTNVDAYMQPLKTIFPIVNASTREPIDNPVNKVLVTGETVYLSNHTTLISKSGEEYQIADSAAPILNDGKILGMVLIFNDVTEQYRIRQELQESEAKFHTLATVAPVGIFKTDRHGNCLYVNEKWCEITELSAEEAKGDGWLKGLHPDDRENVFAEWNKCTTENTPFKLEYRFRKIDSVKWVLGQAIAEINDKGYVVGYVGTITDITNSKSIEKELIQSERKLRLIHEQIPGIVYQFLIAADGKRSLPYVSSSIEKYLGVTAETVMDDAEKWFELTHPVDYPGLEKSILDSMNQLSVWEWEGRFIQKNGARVWLSVTSTPERLNDGSTLWNGVIVDVTERVQANEVIKRSQKMDALGKLTGGIAHDYNNMLGVVLGYAEMLALKLREQPKLQSYVTEITRASERGAKLTRKLLSFSKHKTSELQKLSINNVVLYEQDMLEKTLTVRIELALKLDEKLWSVRLDQSELEDAILNLSINAMHAIDGNGKLTLETSNEQVQISEAERLGVIPGDYVRLAITDTGCGMDDATREKIFDPFYTTKGEQGTGLGLSQVYGFVNRAGGNIHVHSQLGHGTTMSLYFPRFIGEENNRKSPEAVDSSNFKPEATILIVDDEPALLNLAGEILSEQGYKVFKAERAKQALDILEKEKIDLLLSDIIMPEMDGYELSTIVKENYPDIKIQLVSGFSSEGHIKLVDGSISQNLLQKPYSTKELLDTVQTLLQQIVNSFVRVGKKSINGSVWSYLGF